MFKSLTVVPAGLERLQIVLFDTGNLFVFSVYIAQLASHDQDEVSPYDTSPSSVD